MFDLKIIPWKETDAGKEFSKNLEKQAEEVTQSLEESLKTPELSSNLKIMPWDETIEGKEFLENLAKQSQEFAESLRTSLKTPRSLLAEIDINALNKPRFELPSGSGCFVARTNIEKPVKWEMFKPNVYYNDNQGNNYSALKAGQAVKS